VPRVFCRERSGKERSMLRKIIAVGMGVLLSSLVGGAYSQTESSVVQNSHGVRQPILIQGALPIEVEHLLSQLQEVQADRVGGWVFWKGIYQGYPVIISKTRMGMSNAAAATALGIARYQPVAIINQGTAGGHDPKLHTYDVVLGESTVNIGAFRTPKRALGAGSDSLQWLEAFDVLPDDEADPEPIAIRKFTADAELLNAARQVKSQYTLGRVVEGSIGSADTWNNELDRIAFFREHFQTLAEEMEGASAAQIASQFKVPFLAIRVLSNNITNHDAYQAETAQACQGYALTVAMAFMQAHYGQ
jgi:adenosylhomocysteine nucleosidase